MVLMVYFTVLILFNQSVFTMGFIELTSTHVGLFQRILTNLSSRFFALYGAFKNIK